MENFGSDPVKKHDVRILLAEDNETNKELILIMLEKMGYRAEAVSNGEEAVEALKSFSYDLLVMDIHMPEMDGFQATRIIRDKNSGVLNHDIPIIALTGDSEEEDRETCLKVGMDEHICKPINTKLLKDTIGQFLRERKGLNK